LGASTGYARIYGGAAFGFALPVPHALAGFQSCGFDCLPRNGTSGRRGVFVRFIHVHRTIAIEYICGMIHMKFISVDDDERRTLSDCGGVPAGVVLGDTVVCESSCDSACGGS
jgi:hypothetical protein